MKNLKKILAGAITAALVVTMSMTVFAASGINAQEKDLLDYASGKANTLAVTTSQKKMVTDYVAQANTYLSGDGVDLSATDVASLKGTVDEAAAAAKGMDLAKLTAADKTALMNKVTGIMKAGAAKVGISLEVGADGKVVAKAVATGKTAATSGSTVKATGMPVNTTLAVVSTLVVALAGCAIFAKRNKLFA